MTTRSMGRAGKTMGILLLAAMLLPVFGAPAQAAPTAAAPGAPDSWLTQVEDQIQADLDLTGTSTTPNWTVDGELDGDEFGYSVAGAGDVNGDGYADVIVGAWGFNGGAGKGKAYLYYGGPNGLSTNAGWTSSGEHAGNYGRSVAGAGDVNGDGYDDVIVGAPWMSSNSMQSNGKVYLYYGSAAGLGATHGWSAVGEASGIDFGASVAGAGDVNGDGYADLIVGALNYGASFNGKAYVYHGGSGGPSTTANWSQEGEYGYDYYGRSVAGAGDVNGDGFSDVIVGAHGFDVTAAGSSEGRAYVYHGSASGLSPIYNWSDFGDVVGSHFGWSVAGAGDVNGDNLADIVVGAPFFDDATKNEAGRVFVYYGTAPTQTAVEGGSPTPDWIYTGASADTRLGHAVAGAGDLNGDGYADVLIGSLGFADRGAAWAFYGDENGPSNLASDWVINGEHDGDQFGFSVAGAGDVNGDGYSDLLVGAKGYNSGASKGRAYAYHGAADLPGTATAWTLPGTYNGDLLGRSVASAGDVNGDLLADVIVGAPNYPGGTAQGKAYVFHGPFDGLGTVPDWTDNGDGDGDQFGNSVAAAGDVNGDGYGDIIVGAPGYDHNSNNDTGRVYVYYGGSTGLNASPAWHVTGEGASHRFGYAVAGAGDVNGDGYADVLVGAYGYPDVREAGKIYLYLGSASGLGTSASWTYSTQTAGDRLGFSVAGAGDVNGDGYADLIAGLPGLGTGHGRAVVFFGGHNGPGSAPDWSFTGAGENDKVGSAVASAGDVNGDGYADLLVGAPGYPDGTYRGRAYLFYGAFAGPAATPGWTATGPSAGDYLGHSLSGAGDVNGDGYADVLVGAYGFTAGSEKGRAWLYLGAKTGLSATTSWYLTGNLDGDRYGYAVAGAGDVDGDSFADLIIGALTFDGGKGRAALYLGNEGHGRRVTAGQWRADGILNLVHPWGSTRHPLEIVVTMRATDPRGRTRVKVEVEACPAGIHFGRPECVKHRSAQWLDTASSPLGAAVLERVGGLYPDTLFHWRARVLYAPYTVARPGITAPPNPAHGPWRRFLGQAMEADVRTADIWRARLPVALRNTQP